MVKLSGLESDVDIEIRYVGLRPGEKLYEELITVGEGIVPTVAWRGVPCSRCSLHKVPSALQATGRALDRQRVDIKAINDYIACNDSVEENTMASLTIRNIEESLKASLRIRAAEHGRSMEEEARQILRKSLVRGGSSVGLGGRIARRFAAVGGVDLAGVSRSLPRTPPRFGTDE